MQRMMLLTTIVTTSVVLSFSIAPDPEVECVTISAGGVATVDGGVHVLGQFAIGFAVSAGGAIDHGVVPCWRNQDDVPVPGDGDGDGDVDLIDHSGLVDCLDGPGLHPTMNCESFDFDQDNDIDLNDFSILMREFTSA